MFTLLDVDSDGFGSLASVAVAPASEYVSPSSTVTELEPKITITGGV